METTTAELRETLSFISLEKYIRLCECMVLISKMNPETDIYPAAAHYDGLEIEEFYALPEFEQIEICAELETTAASMPKILDLLQSETPVGTFLGFDLGTPEQFRKRLTMGVMTAADALTAQYISKPYPLADNLVVSTFADALCVLLQMLNNEKPDLAEAKAKYRESVLGLDAIEAVPAAGFFLNCYVVKKSFLNRQRESALGNSKPMQRLMRKQPLPRLVS